MDADENNIINLEFLVGKTVMYKTRFGVSATKIDCISSENGTVSFMYRSGFITEFRNLDDFARIKIEDDWGEIKTLKSVLQEKHFKMM